MRTSIIVLGTVIGIGAGSPSLASVSNQVAEDSLQASYHQCINNVMTWHDDKKLNPGQMSLKVVAICHKEGEAIKQLTAKESGKKLTPQLDRYLERGIVDSTTQEVLLWRN